jgi:O-antigen ligase
MKIYIQEHKTIASLLIFVLIASIYLPSRVDGLLTILALPVLYAYKDKFVIERDLQRLAVIFFFFLLFFTLSSQNIFLSTASLGRVLRGMVFFLIAQLFLLVSDKEINYLPHSLLLFLAININFLFKREHIIPGEYFYGYHNHPNVEAFSLCFFLILALILWSMAKDSKVKIINSINVVSALLLLFIANSRSVWFGITAAGLAVIALSPTFNLKRKLVLFSGVAGVGLSWIIFFSKKSSGLAGRDVLWKILATETYTNHPFFGYGLNSNKYILSKFTDIGGMAHNSLVELYSSTGIVGSIIFISGSVFILFRIINIFWRKADLRMSVYLVGLLTFIFISFFDMKLFDYTFMATIFLFLGFLIAGFSVKSVGRRQNSESMSKT